MEVILAYMQSSADFSCHGNVTANVQMRPLAEDFVTNVKCFLFQQILNVFLLTKKINM